jgi:hypothetical protein
MSSVSALGSPAAAPPVLANGSPARPLSAAAPPPADAASDPAAQRAPAPNSAGLVDKLV